MEFNRVWAFECIDIIFPLKTKKIAVLQVNLIEGSTPLPLELLVHEKLVYCIGHAELIPLSILHIEQKSRNRYEIECQGVFDIKPGAIVAIKEINLMRSFDENKNVLSKFLKILACNRTADLIENRALNSLYVIGTSIQEKDDPILFSPREIKVPASFIYPQDLNGDPMYCIARINLSLWNSAIPGMIDHIPHDKGEILFFISTSGDENGQLHKKGNYNVIFFKDTIGFKTLTLAGAGIKGYAGISHSPTYRIAMSLPQANSAVAEKYISNGSETLLSLLPEYLAIENKYEEILSAPIQLFGHGRSIQSNVDISAYRQASGSVFDAVTPDIIDEASNWRLLLRFVRCPAIPIEPLLAGEFNFMIHQKDWDNLHFENVQLIVDYD